ncbi:MAG: ABC transporter ATP-binding protein [Chloroflexi bacterium]|nr:ABC transporter ATP-binding protein [Chloroflexota bacterium]MBV9896755.1 ABC transporter ATP-binding protein [Chloroflexota bacterium]
MSDLAVRVENLGKQYHIGQRAHYNTVREAFSNLVASPFGKLRGRPVVRQPSRHFRSNTFWALRNVSFELRQGELLGIIGRNGAGKSTLLKILSRITEPTEGVADIRGRVRSLLEVGTGFHPELTGRENIYLNGAILGMKRAEITRKFDEIVAFAEIERFIDTPVKWYSSGMYTRLAFSVAAHLEPEVLIVDEVLAVGDIGFQQRCLGKMEEVSAGGRTVFFVSHMMFAITRLCKRVMLIDGGRVIADGGTDDVVAQYNSLIGGDGSAARAWVEHPAEPASLAIRLRSVRARREDGHIAEEVDMGRPVAIEMEYDVLQPGFVLVPSFQFFNQQGACLFASTNPDRADHPRPIGRYTSTCWIPGDLLNEGRIHVGASIASTDPYLVHVSAQHAVAFDVKNSVLADSHLTANSRDYPGLVRPNLTWTTDVATLPTDLAIAV